MDLFYLGIVAVGFALVFSLLWGCCVRAQRQRLAEQQAAQAATTHDHMYVFSNAEQPLVGSVNYYTQQPTQPVPQYMNVVAGSGGASSIAVTTAGGVYGVHVAQPALPAAVLATNADMATLSTAQFPAALPAQYTVASPATAAAASNNNSSGSGTAGFAAPATREEAALPAAEDVYGHATYLPRPPEKTKSLR